MKVFFGVLLLSNIIFFLWEFNSAELNIADVDKTLGAEQIVLLSELDEQTVVVAVAIDESEKLKFDVKNDLANANNTSAAVERKLNQTIETNAEKSSVLEQQELVVAVATGDSEALKPGDRNELVNKNNMPTAAVESIGSNHSTSQAESEVLNNKPSADAEQKLHQMIEINAESVEKTSMSTETPIEPLSSKLPEKSFCYQVGPFLDSKQLQEWVSSNDFNIGVVTSVQQEVSVPGSFLVYYPKADTAEQAKSNTQLLTSKGIKDFWLFRKGELKGVISLGLFVAESRALVLQKQLRKLALPVEIMPRYSKKTAFFAKIMSEVEMSSASVTLSDKLSLVSCSTNLSIIKW